MKFPGLLAFVFLLSVSSHAKALSRYEAFCDITKSMAIVTMEASRQGKQVRVSDKLVRYYLDKYSLMKSDAAIVERMLASAIEQINSLPGGIQKDINRQPSESIRLQEACLHSFANDDQSGFLDLGDYSDYRDEWRIIFKSISSQANVAIAYGKKCLRLFEQQGVDPQISGAEICRRYSEEATELTNFQQQITEKNEFEAGVRPGYTMRFMHEEKDTTTQWKKLYNQAAQINVEIQARVDAAAM